MAITLPTDPICNTIAHDSAYNANYDIIWSFDYSLSGNNTSQGSFTTFLFDGLSSFGGGAPGPGGAYYSAGEYLSGGNTLIIPSLSGAILGINFDTTGLFSLSSPTANGVTTTIPNSLSIRYGQTNFDYLTSISLTSLYTDFDLLLSAQEYNRLRFRLTDIGQTLKVDYRISNNFTEILTIPVNLNITDYTTYKVGIGYTSPVSGEAATQAIFSIRDFHVEGKTEVPEYDTIQPANNSFAVYPVCALPGTETPDTPTVIRTIARIPDVPCPLDDVEQTARGICLADFVELSGGIDSVPVSGVSIAGTYNMTLSSAPTTSTFESGPIAAVCSSSISGVISFNGYNRDIVDFPVSYVVSLGSSTGLVGLDYEVYDQSVKFEVYYPGAYEMFNEYGTLTAYGIAIDTGYVNVGEEATYNLMSELALRDLTSTDPSGEEPGAPILGEGGGNLWWLGTGAKPAFQGLALSSNIVYFNKTTSEPQSAIVRVYGPVDGARYTFSLLCPIPAPVAYNCGTLITGVNLTSPLSSDYTYNSLLIDVGSGTGTMMVFYSAFSLPERFQVIYDNQTVLDTEWVGLSTEQNLRWLNDYLQRVGEPLVETLYSGSSAVNILKPDAGITTMEVRVFAPLYNSMWAVSAGCPGEPYTTPIVIFPTPTPTYTPYYTPTYTPTPSPTSYSEPTPTPTPSPTPIPTPIP